MISGRGRRAASSQTHPSGTFSDNCAVVVVDLVDSLDRSGHVARCRVVELLVKQQAVGPPFGEEVVVAGQHEPVVRRGVGGNLAIGSVCAHDVADGRNGDSTGPPEYVDVPVVDVLVAENTHLLGAALLADVLAAGPFLCPERLHQLRMLVVVFQRGFDLFAVE